jgi:hypothetical protein
MSWGRPKCRHRSQQFMPCCDCSSPWKSCLLGCCLDTDLRKHYLGSYLVTCGRIPWRAPKSETLNWAFSLYFFSFPHHSLHMFIARVFRRDSPPTRSRRSTRTGGESSSMLTSVEGMQYKEECFYNWTWDVTNHNTPQLSQMDLTNHCAAFPGLSLLNTRAVFGRDSAPTRSRRSTGSGGESSSMLTSMEGNSVQAFSMLL